MNQKKSKKKVALCILDGFAFGDPSEQYNAYEKANKPNFLKILQENPHTLIKCSGSSVGLPDDQMGNSEVGHTTIGAGRVIHQMLTRISHSLNNGEFINTEAYKHISNSKKKLHIIGLYSDGGVHSHGEHIEKLAEIFSKTNDVCLHLITDGRDCGINDSLEYIKKIENKFTVSTISGRYFAMDRDNRWDRVKKYYDVLFSPVIFHNGLASEYIDLSYNVGKTDEFIEPIALNNFNGISDNDIVLFANFRPDRMRQIVSSLFDKDFNHFDRQNVMKEGYIMTDYFSDKSITARKLGLRILFEQQDIKNTLSEVISQNGMTQLKVAETEKYPHVTFFFNGQIEAPFEGESRVMIKSPNVGYYNQVPEMKAYEVSTEIIKGMESGVDLIVSNFANCDLIGHTGDFEAAVKSVEVIDDVIGKLYEESKKHDYVLIITADHGNIECMQMPCGEIHTQHTTSDVPFLVCNYRNSDLKSEMSLVDIAPTILKIFDIDKPFEMTGNSIT